MKKIYIGILVLLSVIQSVWAQVYTEEQLNNIGNWDSYSAFSTTASPFTGVDIDGQEEYQLNGIDWPNGDQLKAFMVFDPQRTSPAMEEFWLKPRSGRNLMLFVCNRNRNADNWLISPQVQLKGGNPKLVFYIQNYHNFWQQYQVLVSTTNTNTSSFVKISDGEYIEASGSRDSGDPIGYGWKRISFDLSDYANQRVYLAIRHITPSEGIMMAIDDLSIEGSTSGLQLPVADFSANSTEINMGDVVQFSDASQNSPTSWEWSFPGGSPTSSTSRNPSVTYDYSGTYRVVLKATNSDGTSVETKSEFIKVNKGIKADFAAERVEIYEGENVIFRDFSVGEPTTWEWNFPGSNSVNRSEQNPTVQYANAGTYNVTLTVENGASNNTKTKTSYIKVLPASNPVVNFDANKTDLEEGDQIRFIPSVTGGALTYQWTFEGASPPTSSEETPNVTYFNEGSYNVTLKVTNTIGEDSEVKNGYINVVQKDKDYCSAGVNSAGTRGIANVTFGAINNSTQADNYTYYKTLETRVDPGQTYPISITSSGQGFAVDATGRGNKVAIWIDWNQDGDFRDSGEVKVINNTGSTQYQGSISVPVDALGRRTRMRVRAYYSFENGDEDACGNKPEGEVEDYVIYVNKAELNPIANFTSNTRSVPVGAYVNFEDTSDNRVTYWEWNFESGTPTVSYDKNPQIQYNTPGEYSVTLKVSNSSGTDTKTETRFIQVTGGDIDTQAPSVPQNLVASSVTTTSLHLNWSASTDNVGVTGYEIYRDNVLITTSTSTSYADSGLTPDTLYSYYVRAKDQAGNISQASTTLQVRTLKEVTDPTCDDGIQNGDETGVDCGGSSCPACPTCDDGIQNGDETGIDCGGSCDPCPTCNDGIQNGDETGIDCGGSCDPCSDTVTYCIASNAGASLHITNVTFGTIDNSSAHNPYSDYTAISTNAKRGDQIALTIKVNNEHWTYNAVGTWIDWNRDGDFEDTGEEVFSKFSAGPYNTNVTVPATAVTKSPLRVRVRIGYGSADKIIPCGVDTYLGEVEDYTLIITDDGSVPTCNDGIQNGDETGIDCGGSCQPCVADPTCTDGVQNGDETGIDCGGAVCPPCNTNTGVVYVDIDDVTVTSSDTWKFFRIEVGDDNGFGAWYTGSSVRLVTYDKNLVCEGSTNNVSLLGENVGIDGASNFVAESHSYIVSSSSYNNWNGKTGYIGFTFKVNGNTHYGWFHITVASDGLSYTILDYAYQTNADTVIYTNVNRAFEASVDEDNQIKIHPNPFTSNFEIDLQSIGQSYISVEVYDLYGKKIIQQNHKNNPEKITVGQELSSTGIYYVVIRTREDVIIKRVVKK